MERWKINLYAIWTGQVFSLMGFGLAVPFIPYYLQQLGSFSHGTLNFYVGLASTIPAATMAVAAPVWGAVSDRYGRKMMLMRAMVAAAIILALMGTVKSVWLFLVLRALQGIFSGTVTASMAFVSANTPSNRISFALGFMTSSNFLGYSIGPFVGGILAEIIGYRLCFIIGGVILALGFLVILVFVKEDPDSFGKRLTTKNSNDTGEKVRLVTPFIISVLISVFLVRVGRLVFTPFVALLVQNSMGTMTGAATYTGLINGATGIATAISAVTITRLGDRHDKFKLAFLLTLISLPVSLLLIPKYPLIIFVPIYALYFFFAGSIEPILTSAASEVTDAQKKGALFGMLGTISSVSMMVAPMIGAATSARFGIHSILMLIPMFVVVQIVLLYLNRKRGKKKEDDD